MERQSPDSGITTEATGTVKRGTRKRKSGIVGKYGSAWVTDFSRGTHKQIHEDKSMKTGKRMKSEHSKMTDPTLSWDLSASQRPHLEELTEELDQTLSTQTQGNDLLNAKPEDESISPLLFGIPGPLPARSKNACVVCLKTFRGRLKRPSRLMECQGDCGFAVHLKCACLKGKMDEPWRCDGCKKAHKWSFKNSEIELDRRCSSRSLSPPTSFPEKADRREILSDSSPSRTELDCSAQDLDSELRQDLARWSVEQCSTFFSSHPILADLITAHELSGSSLLLISQNQFLKLFGLTIGMGLKLFNEIAKWRRIHF